MKHLLLSIPILLLLSVAGYAQSYVTVTGTVRDGAYRPKSGVILTITPTNIPGVVVNPTPYKSSSSSSTGYLSFRAIRGGTYTITGPALQWEDGRSVTIPASGAVTLDSLQTATSVPEEGLTVRDEGVALGQLAGVVNFVGAGVTATGGAGTVTVTIPGGGDVASVFGRTGAVTAQSNDYTWAQINKTTSSLADIATRSASDLNSGTLPLARLSGITNTEISASAAIALSKLSITGTPNGTKFLRDDGSWQAVAGGSSTTKRWFPAAGCDGTAPYSAYDLMPTLQPTPICVTGSNTQKGVLEFPDTDGDYSGQITESLPSDYSGTVDVKLKWLAAATSGNVVWQVQTSCVADAETDDPAWNTASTVTDAAKGTTLQTNDASISSVTVTGCAAGELMHLRILRNRTHASDTISGTVRLIGFELSVSR